MYCRIKHLTKYYGLYSISCITTEPFFVNNIVNNKL